MSGIARYVPWQALDFVLDRGRSSMVVIVLFWLQASIGMREVAEVPQPARVRIAEGVLDSMVPLIGFVLVLFAINGIVAADRKSGVFRMLLGKPVSAAGYYGQAFALHGLGTLALGAVFLLGYSAIAGTSLSVAGVAYFGMYYVLLGGIGFALSTVARFDWASTAAVWIGTVMVRSMLPIDARWYTPVVDAVLPPTHAVSDAGEALLRGVAPEWTAVSRVIGYGALAVGFALVRLRRRPFDE
jgi:hypothetical protein